MSRVVRQFVDDDGETVTVTYYTVAERNKMMRRPSLTVEEIFSIMESMAADESGSGNA